MPLTPLLRRATLGVALAVVLAAAAGNPLVRQIFTADPAARVFGDRIYVYTSHDETDAKYFDMFDWRLFSTADLVTWQDHGSVFHVKDFAWAKQYAWAPDAIAANGKYYLFLPVDRTKIGVAVSASPTGPFTDAIGAPLIDYATMPEAGREPIDPALFTDDDGTTWLYFGCRQPMVVKLAPSLTALAGPLQPVVLLDPARQPVPQAAPGKQPALPMSYGEAPVVFKRGGKYYYVYSNGWAKESTLVYALGDSPTGPFTYAGEVMKHVACVTHHGSLVEFRGKWYVFYHTSELSGGNTYRRAVCVDELTFAPDGRIIPVTATPSGPAPAAALPPRSQVRPGAPVEKSPLPVMPPVIPLFDYPIRDTSICVGHDGAYYLTGTTGSPDWWGVTGDIQVWRSEDLQRWTPVVQRPRQRSVVWNVDREGTWEKRIPIRDGAPFRPLWAPEIAYLKGTYWIGYSLPLGVGGGLLKSTSGKPEGPYVAMFKDAPAVNAIDLALFADDDGKVYLVWGSGNIRELNAELNGFVGEAWKLKPANADRIGFEGTFVFKRAGKYYITGAEFVANPDGGAGADYHCYAAIGDSLRGPFGDKFLALPHGGHNSFFADRDGNWWATLFGNDPRAPFQQRPGILRIEFGPDGRFAIAREQPPFVLRK